MTEFRVLFHVEPEGEDPHEFVSVIEAPDAANALARAREAGVIATVTTWRDLGEIRATDFNVSILGDDGYKVGAIVAVAE